MLISYILRICKSQQSVIITSNPWESGDSGFPNEGVFDFLPGYYAPTHTVWLIGGIRADPDNVIVSFDVMTQLFTTHGHFRDVIPDLLDTQSSASTFIGDTIYFAYEAKLGTFAMSTQTLSYPWPAGEATKYTVPVDDPLFRSYCMTHDASGRYLFLIGGQLSVFDEPGSMSAQFATTQIYDLTAEVWITTAPAMNFVRDSAVCEVVGDYLYVLGGEDDGDYLPDAEKLDISDIPNIHSGSWTLLSETMSVGRSHSASVVVDNFIFVVGGNTGSPHDSNHGLDLVELLDTTSDEFTVLNPLREPRGWMPLLAVPSPTTPTTADTLYTFGGRAGDYINTWEYYRLQVSVTSSPTKVPVSSPTAAPTADPNAATTAAPTTKPTPATAAPTADLYSFALLNECVLRDADAAAAAASDSDYSLLNQLQTTRSSIYLSSFWRCIGSDPDWAFHESADGLSLLLMDKESVDSQFRDWVPKKLQSFADDVCQSRNETSVAVSADKGYGYLLSRVSGDLVMDFNPRLRDTCNEGGYSGGDPDLCGDSRSVCAIPRKTECTDFLVAEKDSYGFTDADYADACSVIMKYVGSRNKFLFSFRQKKDPIYYADTKLCLFNYFFVCE